MRDELREAYDAIDRPYNRLTQEQYDALTLVEEVEALLKETDPTWLASQSTPAMWGKGYLGLIGRSAGGSAARNRLRASSTKARRW